jgi:transcriptional regulator with XRE-family HTH domain
VEGYASKELVEMPPRSVGAYIREWRRRRHLSQLDCALDADISQRHLSFIESGRAAPSRGMVLHLAEALDVPLRERNTLLLAAGFAISRTAIGHAGAKASARRH